MEDLICTIDISKMSLDNEFSFYKNGEIERIYDSGYNDYEQNKKEIIFSKNINPTHKKKILEKCPFEYLDLIKSILK